MTKHLFSGAVAVALFSMLCATMAPAPLFAATINPGAHIEQTSNPGNNGQNDQNNNQNNNGQGQNQQGQNQQGQNQQGQNQGQGGQGQPQGNTQGNCFAGSDQASANFPTGCWVSLEAGGRDWYQFRYQGLAADRNDEDSNSSSNNSSQPATVDARLKMDTPGCISFWVMTQERLQNPDPDDKGFDEPVGAGTPVVTQNNNNNSSDSSDDNSNNSDNNNSNSNNDNNNRDDSVLGWQGAANANITFYIIVRNNRDFSCSYNLSLSGAGVPVQGQQQGQQNQQNQQSNQNNGQNNNGQNSNNQNGNSQNNNGQNGNGQNNNGQNNNGQNNNNHGGTNG